MYLAIEHPLEIDGQKVAAHFLDALASMWRIFDAI